MVMFENFVIPKKPCRSYVLRLSFCTIILHQSELPFYACKTSAFYTLVLHAD